MCGLKQGMNEPIKTFMRDYYERMADISVKLEQYHSDCFGPGELSLMKKDCFYVGLKEHNKYLVSDMKDQDQYSPAQMLKEIWEQEDSCYPANMTPKLLDNQNKSTTHYNRKNMTFDKSRAYAVRQTDVLLPDPAQGEPGLQPAPEFGVAETYDEGYYVAVVNTANEADKWDRCFNCGEEGHRWQECTKLLKESLRRVKE